MTQAATEAASSRQVLLVGSVPLDTPAEVFAQVGETLGPTISRIPDGEPGDRLNWIVWQRDNFYEVDGLEVKSYRQMGSESEPRPLFGLVDGVAEDTLAFPPLGYADAARSSYRTFVELRKKGVIADGPRFQVCLPTPLAVVFHFADRKYIRGILPAYERSMLGELKAITAEIPPCDLAIQWDVCSEITRFLEDPAMMEDFSKEEVLAPVVRLCNAVPGDVELAIHLCYGDFEHRHTMEPLNCGLMVGMANYVSSRSARPVSWFHLPVPIERDDPAYFRPLADMDFGRDTQLFLGLIHYRDGVEGARKRAVAASEFVADFGVATECGFGRRPAQTIRPLLELHREVAAAV